MNSYLFTDESFKNTNSYKEFISDNKGIGYLNIRSYAASSAVPISDVDIEVSKVIDNNKIIFYRGNTDESGVISSISLPCPLVGKNDEVIPLSATYNIKAVYKNDTLNYIVDIYDKISVLQNINIVPSLRLESSNYVK